jgi:hypothetical protein
MNDESIDSILQAIEQGQNPSQGNTGANSGLTSESRSGQGTTNVNFGLTDISKSTDPSTLKK